MSSGPLASETELLASEIATQEYGYKDILDSSRTQSTPFFPQRPGPTTARPARYYRLASTPKAQNTVVS
jgi:hypothetical protein